MAIGVKGISRGVKGMSGSEPSPLWAINLGVGVTLRSIVLLTEGTKDGTDEFPNGGTVGNGSGMFDIEEVGTGGFVTGGPLVDVSLGEVVAVSTGPADSLVGNEVSPAPVSDESRADSEHKVDCPIPPGAKDSGGITVGDIGSADTDGMDVGIPGTAPSVAVGIGKGNEGAPLGKPTEKIPGTGPMLGLTGTVPVNQGS